jgi:hypothetical protein
MLSYTDDGVGGAWRAPSCRSCHVMISLQRNLCLSHLRVVSYAVLHCNATPVSDQLRTDAL